MDFRDLYFYGKGSRRKSDGKEGEEINGKGNRNEGMESREYGGLLLRDGDGNGVERKNGEGKGEGRGREEGEGR